SYRFIPVCPGKTPEVLRQPKCGNYSDPGNQRSSTGWTEIFGQCPAPETFLEPVSWDFFAAFRHTAHRKISNNAVEAARLSLRPLSRSVLMQLEHRAQRCSASAEASVGSGRSA